MKKMPSLGEIEMELLCFVEKNEPASVREVASHFEKAKGLARTTVLTMMERLRAKGFLVRTKADGLFKYSAKHETSDVVGHKISHFVEKTLGGSVSPLLAYFSSSKLSDEEIEQLKTLASKLESGRGKS